MSYIRNSNKPKDFALIIGAMKCGTTSLFHHLGQHPQIAQSRLKEPGFFMYDEHWKKGLDWYLDLWDWDPGTHRIAIEASTHYTKTQGSNPVPERIRSIEGANFKLIYVMRHPVARIESHIRHGLRDGWSKSLDAGVPEMAIALTRYAYQIDSFMNHFSKSDIYLVTLEEIKRDMAKALSNICEFLQVDSNFAFPGTDRILNSGAEMRVPPAILNGMLESQFMRSVMPERIWRTIGKIIRKMTGQPVAGRYQLTEEERSTVLAKLYPDLRRLHAEYQVDVKALWDIDLET